MEKCIKNKIVFLTFSDTRFMQSLEYTKEDSLKFPFSDRKILTEKDLPKDFLSILRPRLYRRGFGYWRWKPFIVKQCLRNMNENDILLYCDGGTRLNVNGMDRFKEYVELCNATPSGILAFSQPFLEKDYSKGDLLQYLGVYNNEDYTMSLQLWAGAFMVRKCNVSVTFIDEWNKISIENPDLITDKKSIVPNLNGFLENRHDQSVFSVLAKRWGAYVVSYNEGAFCLGDNVRLFSKYPIIRKPSIDNSILGKRIVRILVFPYKYAIGTWLIVFRKFAFQKKRSY